MAVHNHQEMKGIFIPPTSNKKRNIPPDLSVRYGDNILVKGHTLSTAMCAFENVCLSAY